MFSVPLQAIVLSIVIHTLWGGNPIAAKFGLEAFPPAWSAFIRLALGVATIAAWCWYRGHRLWPDQREWVPILKIGTLFTIQILLMNIGFDLTSGINASILISTNPLFAAIFAHYLISSDRLTQTRGAGLLIAFIGVCITLIQTTEHGIHLGGTGDWLCLASAWLLGLRLIISANEMKQVDPFRLAQWQMIFSLPFYALIGIATETILWSAVSTPVILGLLYQGVIIAGIGFMVSLWLISRYQPSVMAGYNFISPVSGVLLAAWLLGESISALVITGTALVAVGMVLITLRS